jgi:O-methyltransferase involved in polyketide biosynthesis
MPETIRLREILLPQSPRLRTPACSAFEERWIDEVDVSRGALVTAQGLLMYFERSAVHGLIATCARRLPRGELVFDAVPEWLSKRSQRGDLKTAGGYQAPPWLWSVNADEERRLASLHLNITELRRIAATPWSGRPPRLRHADPQQGPALRRRILSVFGAQFGPV